jgi:hypothetical protein
VSKEKIQNINTLDDFPNLYIFDDKKTTKIPTLPILLDLRMNCYIFFLMQMANL